MSWSARFRWWVALPAGVGLVASEFPHAWKVALGMWIIIACLDANEKERES